ncbi:hypothetical protein C1I63_02005 [Rathayibacter caricis DSM 15933]|uniref:Fibronectin type-III domain-containing protein n=1 Tax=Rathayibacter caricis DSM 15933 TaxID=1328867 RepID=A0A2T4UQE4_9MICO|nr:fibronectin type III domain-containing protein [Rathayibacter caricis]PTL71740.1 hypothetical protein C1I63_02005 [Rathayibacter caricis DSM 15933]
MRRTAASFSLLLVLLMSFLVASPAQAAGSPSAPTNIVAATSTCTTPVLISWDAPSAPVRGYRVHVYQTIADEHEDYVDYYDDTVALYSVSGSTSLSVDLPYGSYHFEVASVLDFTAPFSGGSNGVRLQASATQSAPTKIDFTHVANTPAPSNLSSSFRPDLTAGTFSWSNPTPPGGECGFEYFVWTLKSQYSETYDDGSREGFVDSSITTTTVPLERNMRYEFCVRAASGWQPSYEGEIFFDDLPATCTKFNTGSSVPSPVSDIRADEDGASITITWDAPSRDGGANITGYRVGRDNTDASGSGPWKTVVAADRRSQTFTNLRPNTEYTFFAQPVNANGSGEISTVTIVSQPYYAPSEPRNVVAIPDGATRSAVLKWVAPESTGGTSITGYRVARNGIDAAGAGPWSTIVSPSKLEQTFTNLAAGASYILSVSAINVAGESQPVERLVVVGGSILTAPTPTISGTATVGSTLTANAGTWGPAPVALAYQWRANGTAISGATAGTYRLASADAGKTITVAVTGSKSGYVSTTRVSTATAAVSGGALTAATPTVTGTAKVGSTLTANTGTWGPAPVTFSYQWKADGVALSGATAGTYKPSSATLGKKITVTVTGSKTGYTGSSRTSVATAAVVAGTLTAVTPTITGTARVGSTLTAVPGAWGPAPVAFTYQWKANGTALSGATGSTYQPSAATLGKTITVTVSGTKVGYTSATRTSAATAAVASGTLTAATPKITGTAKVGSTLTATAGTWGPAPVALTYQWKANGTAISGATATTYKPTSATVGRTITVTVTGKKTAYTTATRTSAATAAVVR